jgi:Putative beta-barrel porin 2
MALPADWNPLMIVLLGALRRSLLGLLRLDSALWRFGVYIFLNFACMAMAQEDNGPLRPLQPNDPRPAGDSDTTKEINGASNSMIPLMEPPSAVGLSLDKSKVPDVPGNSSALNQTAQLISAPSGIPISQGTEKISTDDLSGPAGMNQMTSPGPGISAETGPTNGEIPTANREAGDKKWLLLFNLSTGVTYDDNIFISNQHKQADEIFTVSGGLTLGLGDYRNLVENYLLAQYELTGYFFVHNSQEDSPEQELALKTQYRFSKLTLQTQTRYAYLSGVNRQVGNFVNQNIIDNLIRLSYDYSDKTQFYASFEQITNLYESFLNSYEYIARFGGEYQVTPKIQLGGEGVLGMLDQEASASSDYAQLRLLANYDLTGKLTFHLSAGGEFRHYDSSGDGLTKGNFVFSLGLTYRPFPDTSVGLTAYRNVNASPSAANESYTATGVALQLSQLLYRRLTADISAGYENDNYQATENGAAEAGRLDNYFFIRPSLTYRFRSWLSTSLAYEFRRNSSNEANFMFSDNRITFSVGVNF